jgi:hypothetical protein
MTFRNLMAIAAIPPAILFGRVALSQQSSSTPIVQDNSFLMEEAYNQEEGIVQHIFTLQTYRGTSDYDGSFTQEWPVGGLTHQLSYDIFLTRSDRKTGIGDFRINYRYQLIGSGETRLAMAPRLSMTLPTGDWKQGRGSGAVGIETMLPVSYVISPLVTTHSNVGVAFTPSARNTTGARANTYQITLAQSFILTANNNIQPLVETVYTRESSVFAENTTEWSNNLVVSPGVRFAINFRSGLQIVPGIALPIPIGSSDVGRGTFFYLSFEHPFTHSGKR